MIEIKIKRGPHNTRIVHIAAAQVSTTAVIHVLITIKVLFSIVLSFLHEATSDFLRSYYSVYSSQPNTDGSHTLLSTLLVQCLPLWLTLSPLA